MYCTITSVKYPTSISFSFVNRIAVRLSVLCLLVVGCMLMKRVLGIICLSILMGSTYNLSRTAAVV